MLLEGNFVNLFSDDLVGTLNSACDATMPRQSVSRNRHRLVYLGCPEIVGLRLRARRRMQRARIDGARKERNEAYRATKQALKNDIVRARKLLCFYNLCQAANTRLLE